MLLTILNLSFTDVLTLVIAPLAGGIYGWTKHLDEQKDKRKLAAELESEKDKRRVEAEVEKERIAKQAEVDRERERSVGGEAVLKIWKEITKIQDELKKLNESYVTDHSNDLIVNQIITRLQEDVSKLMSVLFDNFIKR